MIEKFVLTTTGEAKPLVASSSQWEQIREHLAKGATPIHTAKETIEIFAVLEIAKGYEGKGISNSKDGMLMLFGEVN